MARKNPYIGKIKNSGAQIVRVNPASGEKPEKDKPLRRRRVKKEGN